MVVGFGCLRVFGVGLGVVGLCWMGIGLGCCVGLVVGFWLFGQLGLLGCWFWLQFRILGFNFILKVVG